MKRFPRRRRVSRPRFRRPLLRGADARPGTEREELDLSAFRDDIAQGEVATAEIKDRDNVVQGKLRDDTDYKVSYPAEFADELVDELDEAKPGIEVTTDSRATRSGPACCSACCPSC